MTSVDVLIITALPEEYDAARTAGLHFASGAGTQWRKHDQATPAPYETIQIPTTAGALLSIALARPTRMGGRSTAPIATALAERLGPQCLAMSGVCAGNPDAVALGDVVVAEMAYEYDEGKRAAADFVGDHRHLLLDDAWFRAVQEFSPSELPSYGPITRDEATMWFLERLLAGHEPRSHPARARYFHSGTWRTWPAEMQNEGLIERSGQGWALTDEGRRFVEHRLYDDVDGPDALPFAVKVAPMASGSAVVKDGLTWAQLSQMSVRTVAALEMEAATIATVARQQQIPHWLVAKGVMDHADPRKDDRYKRFAARASAEVLYAMVTRLIVPRPADETDSRFDSAPATSGHGRLDTPATTTARAQVSAPNLDDLTDAHQRTLQLVSDLFGQHDSWPAFNLIDRPLRRQGINAANAVTTMPAGLLAGVRAHAQPVREDLIQLTVRGMACCRATEPDVDLFLAVTRWAAVLDKRIRPR